MPLIALHRGDPVLVASVAVEVVEEALEYVRGGNEVGVKDNDELCIGIGVFEGNVECPSLEALPVLAMYDLDAGSVGPALQYLCGFIGGVVDDNHFVVRVVERGAACQYPLRHVLLVVEGQVDRDQRRLITTVVERQSTVGRP